MYGQPIKPEKCLFNIFIDDGTDDMYVAGDGDICLCITDEDCPDNDDIRDIDHPDFDKYWGNAAENVFLSDGFKHFKSLGEAKQWCFEVGMKENL